jgi:hypothetical protein
MDKVSGVVKRYIKRNWDKIPHDRIRQILGMHTSQFYRVAHQLKLEVKPDAKGKVKKILMKYIMNLKWLKRPFNVADVNKKEQRGKSNVMWFINFCRKHPEYFCLSISKHPLNVIVFNDVTRDKACEMVHKMDLKATKKIRMQHIIMTYRKVKEDGR